MEVKGRIEKVFETQVISDKFKKREFVIVTDGQYPQFIKMQCTQARCESLEGYNTGDNVTCKIDIKGRSYEKNGEVNYFTNIECWKIKKEGQQVQQPQAPVNTAPPCSKCDGGSRKNITILNSTEMIVQRLDNNSLHVSYTCNCDTLNLFKLIKKSRDVFVHQHDYLGQLFKIDIAGEMGQIDVIFENFNGRKIDFRFNKQ